LVPWVAQLKAISWAQHEVDEVSEIYECVWFCDSMFDDFKIL